MPRSGNPLTAAPAVLYVQPFGGRFFRYPDLRSDALPHGLAKYTAAGRLLGRPTAHTQGQRIIHLPNRALTVQGMNSLHPCWKRKGQRTMECIFFTGNSNTWGQGADGVWESFSPPPVAGDHRPVPFGYDSFVNLFRRKQNAQTGSRCREYDAAALHLKPARELSFAVEGALLRLFIRRGPASGRVQVSVDGRTLAVLDAWSPPADNPVCWYGFRLEQDGPHRIELTCLDEGTVDFYRLESYTGFRAVVNAAVGSCPSDRYLSEYWPAVRELLRPGDGVVLPFAINCWIHQLPLSRFEDNLRRMAAAAQERGARAAIMTLAPVLEEQYIGSSGIPYRAYNQSARTLAAAMGLPLIDAEAGFDRALDGQEEPARREKAYRDKWHVNSWGHRLYAQCIEQSGIF